MGSAISTKARENPLPTAASKSKVDGKRHRVARIYAKILRRQPAPTDTGTRSKGNKIVSHDTSPGDSNGNAIVPHVTSTGDLNGNSNLPHVNRAESSNDNSNLPLVTSAEATTEHINLPNISDDKKTTSPRLATLLATSKSRTDWGSFWTRRTNRHGSIGSRHSSAHSSNTFDSQDAEIAIFDDMLDLVKRHKTGVDKLYLGWSMYEMALEVLIDIMRDGRAGIPRAAADEGVL